MDLSRQGMHLAPHIHSKVCLCVSDCVVANIKNDSEAAICTEIAASKFRWPDCSWRDVFEYLQSFFLE